jgi:hypothetical protein
MTRTSRCSSRRLARCNNRSHSHSHNTARAPASTQPAAARERAVAAGRDASSAVSATSGGCASSETAPLPTPTPRVRSCPNAPSATRYNNTHQPPPLSPSCILRKESPHILWPYTKIFWCSVARLPRRGERRSLSPALLRENGTKCEICCILQKFRKFVIGRYSPWTISPR